MVEFWPTSILWLMQILIVGAVVLAIGRIAVRRVPAADVATRRRVAVWSVRMALATVGLTLLPAWWWISLPKNDTVATQQAKLQRTIVVPEVMVQDDAQLLTIDAQDLPMPVEVVKRGQGIGYAKAITNSTRPQSEPLLVLPAAPVLTEGVKQPTIELTIVAPPPTLVEQVVPILLVPYAAWVFGSLAWYGLGCLALSRLCRRAVPASDYRQEQLSVLCGMQRVPRLLVSDTVGSPVCFGIWRPTILVPRLLANQASPSEWRFVLQHELDHLARGDAWNGLFVALAMSLYGVVPWFWTLKCELARAQEHLADAAAAGSDPLAYASFLVELSSQPRVPRLVRHLPSATGVRASESELLRRVRMLVEPQKENRRASRLWAIIAGGGVVSASVVLSGLGLADDKPKPKAAKPKIEIEVVGEPIKPATPATPPAPKVATTIRINATDLTKSIAELEEKITAAAAAGKVDEVKTLVAKLKTLLTQPKLMTQPANSATYRVEMVQPGLRVDVPAPAKAPETKKLEAGLEQLKKALKEVENQPEAKAALEKSIAEYQAKIAEALAKTDLSRAVLDKALVERVKQQQGQAQFEWHGQPQVLQAMTGNVEQIIQQIEANSKLVLEGYAKKLEAIKNNPEAEAALKVAMNAYSKSIAELVAKIKENNPRGVIVQGFFNQALQGNALVDLNLVDLNFATAPKGGTLGVQIEEVPAAVRDQIDLPAKVGVLLSGIIAASPAEKAGLKVNDLLVKIGGNDVSDDTEKAVTVIRSSIKPGKTVDVVVFRKGKPVEVRGILIPEVVMPKPTAKPKTGSSSSLSVSVSNDNFTVNASKDDVKYAITGKIVDGKATPSSIEITRDNEAKKYESLDKVPADDVKIISGYLSGIGK